MTTHPSGAVFSFVREGNFDVILAVERI